MEKLADIKIGTKIAMSLVVLEAAERKTKAGKPYVTVKLSDGTTQITGNYWDWPEGAAIPERGLVYKVGATVGDWQGTPQLNISAMTEDKEANIADFVPTSDVDIDHVFDTAVYIASRIKDTFLNKVVMGILTELEGRWKTIPGARTVHHAYKAGTLIHSVDVARVAINICNAIPEANEDLVIAGALLHDLGKLFTYGFDGAAIDYTDEGKLYEHIFMGAEFVGNYAEDLVETHEDACKLTLLRHIILSHHGSLEHGSPVTPRFIEAYIVHHADMIDATVEQIKAADNKAGSPWTDKIWTLNNMPHLRPSYIDNKVFPQLEETV